MVARPDIQTQYSQDTTSFTEMSTSSPTAKTTTATTTTTTMTTLVDRTKVDLTAIGKDKDSSDMENIQQDTGDREYLEQIMGCGDVRRKILRLESSGSTESLESSNVTPKYIGDNVPIVKEVVQSIEDKICSTVVSAIPFAVQKRERLTEQDQKKPNVVELEKQILTDADIALEKLIKCEPPTEVVKLSPVEAMELREIGIAHINEEVCEKVCEKRKAFEVAKDLSETHKTLEEQVIGLNRQVKQVPGHILTESIDEHKDLVSKNSELETLPKVMEAVQDIERRYPSTILEVIPFSPRKRETVDRKADVSSIEQQIFTETDLVLHNLCTMQALEGKVVSPILETGKSTSTENLEAICEKKCSKRKVSDMAKVLISQRILKVN